MKNITRLKHFTRNDAALPAAYSANATLPPRDTFAGNGEILAAYDTLVRLQEAERENGRASRDKKAQAVAAAADYQMAVAEALRQGKDPAKVKNTVAQLEAESEAHAQFASDARAQASAAGVELGRLVQAQAIEHFEGAERQMQEAADTIADHVAALREAWDIWGTAWGLRSHLSQVVHRGGVNQQYRAVVIPQHVADALAVVADTLDDLDNLKAEELQLAEWRATQAAALATNARGFGG